MHRQRSRSRERASGTPLYLNVYDLLEYNKYGYVVGVGAFHSGVEIYGTGIHAYMDVVSMRPLEYSFGGHDVEDVTGVFEVRPRGAQALRFRFVVFRLLRCLIWWW